MEKQQIEKIFNRFCTLVNKDYNEYRIRDKEGFIKAIASNKASQFVQSSIPELTDKKIEKEAIKRANDSVKDYDNPNKPIDENGQYFANGFVRGFIDCGDWYRTRLRELKGENNPVFQKLKDKGLIDESYVAMDKVSEICDKAAKRMNSTFTSRPSYYTEWIRGETGYL